MKVIQQQKRYLHTNVIIQLVLKMKHLNQGVTHFSVQLQKHLIVFFQKKKKKQPSEQWQKVNIQTMYKGKASKKMLNNIFWTNILSKIFGKIVYSKT